jgi:hypothetical protein
MVVKSLWHGLQNKEFVDFTDLEAMALDPQAKVYSNMDYQVLVL